MDTFSQPNCTISSTQLSTSYTQNLLNMEALSGKNLSSVLDSCQERVKEGLELTLARALKWTLHPSEEDAVSELARGELVFLMAVSSLANLDVEISGMLLKEVERWSIFPRIKKYMSGKMDAEWKVPRKILDRASKFAHVLEVSGLFAVPPELRAYLAELLAEDAAGGSEDASESKRPRKDPRSSPSQQVEEYSTGGQASVADLQQGRRYGMATRGRRPHKQGGREQENKGKQAPSLQQVTTSPPKTIAKPTPESSEIQTSSYLLQTNKNTGAIPKIRPPAKTKTPKSAPSPPTEAFPKVRKLSTSAAQMEEPQPSAAPEETLAAAQPPPPQPRMSKIAARRQLWEGVEKNDGQLVEGAVLSGADLNELRADKGYMTPLALAVSEGRVGMVRALVRLGAQLEVETGEEKRTVLHLASVGGHVAVVSELLAAGADVDVEDSNKCTPLHLASGNGHAAIVRELVASGANIGATDSNKYTSLHLASRGGHLDVVRVLLAAGANLEAKGANKSTPLHRASQRGHEAVVLDLLEAGANVGALDCDGYTPLHWASHNGHLATVRLLVEDGAADFNTSYSSGYSPLQLARLNKHTAVAEYLRSVGATK